MYICLRKYINKQLSVNFLSYHVSCTYNQENNFNEY